MMKKLYITALSMILLTMTFTTATFAWVSMAETNKVDGLQIAMRDGSNLEFSLDGTNWSNEITTAQINQIWNNSKLLDLTSTDGIQFVGNRLPLLGSELTFEGIPNQNYIALELFVRTTTRYNNVYLVDNISSSITYDSAPNRGTYVTSRGVTFRSPLTFLYGPDDTVFENETRTYFAKDAIRISLIEMKTDNPLDTRDESELARFIYDPTENPVRGYGKAYGSIDYLSKAKLINIPLPTTTQPVIERLSAFDPFFDYQPLDTLSKVATLIETDQLDDRDRPYYLGRFTLNIWIEGWDADTFDAIYADTLLFRFEFQGALPIA